MQEANFNRINLALIPLILCIGVFIHWLGERWKKAEVAAVAVLLVAFGAFTLRYHSAAYRQEIGTGFTSGFQEAIDYARQGGDGPVCIIKNVYLGYIYVLFAEQGDPRQMLESMVYVSPDEPLREVSSLGRYTFGVENCARNRATIYVLRGSWPPFKNIQYEITKFGEFRVFRPWGRD